MKLLVNACGHSLCESCVELLFVRGSAKCPTDNCRVMLRRANFRVQLYDDNSVEKEIDVRKRVLRDFNKKESDFSSLLEYNNYLEEVETIIFNLSNGIDVAETEQRIKAYKEQNQEAIRKNRSKLSADELLLEQLIAEEHELMSSNLKTHEEELQLVHRRQKQHDQLIDDLSCSDLPASRIVDQHRTVNPGRVVQSKEVAPPPPPPVSRPTMFSSGVPMAFNRDTIGPMQPVVSAELYHYTPQELELMGPKPPSVTQILSDSYLSNVRSATVSETAGGFQSYLSCQRALLDAFCGLTFEPTESMSDTNVSMVVQHEGS